MKRTVKLLLFIGVIVAGIIGLNACQKKPTELNVLSGFRGHTDYIISQNDEKALAFDYEKGLEEDASITKSVKGLKDFKTLLIDVEGSGSIAIILENENGTESKKVSLYVPKVGAKYEWDLRNDSAFLSKVKTIRIIAAPGKTEQDGNVRITKLMFSNELADNYVIQTDFYNIPSNIHEYDGVADEFHFNSKWTNNEANTDQEPIFEFEYIGEKAVVSFDKKGSDYSWAFFYTLIKGDFSGFDYMIFRVKGTAGPKIVAKFEYTGGEIESSVVLNGDEQEIAIDFTSLTAEQKKTISRVLIFGDAGVSNTQGTFEILDAYLTADYTIDDPIVYNIYNGTDEVFKIGNWRDFGDAVYTFEKLAEYTKLTYKKKDAGQDWALAIAYVKDSDLSQFERLVFDVQGEKNKKALFKLELDGAPIEKELVFSGDREEVSIDLTGLTTAELKTIKHVIIFADHAKSANATGEILLYDVYFDVNPPVVLVGINNNYVSNDAGVYEFTYEETTKVDFAKVATQEWAYFYREVTEEEREGQNTLKMVFSGTAGDIILVKPNDKGAYEMMLTLDANGEAIYEKYIDEPIVKIMVFVKPNELGTGTLTIVESGLKYVKPAFSIPVEELNHQIVVEELIDSGDGVYTFEQVGTTIKVIYDKPAGLEWTTMRVDLNTYPKLKDYNYFKIELKGTPEKQVLVKVNGIEKWVTFDAEGLGQAEFASKSFNEILLFAEGGVAPVASSFEILNAVLEYRYDFRDLDFTPMSGYTYQVDESGNLVITYTDVSGYMAQVISFPKAANVFNIIDMRIETTPGVKVLFKANNKNEHELILTADDEGIILYSYELDETLSLILFVNPGGEIGVSGTLKITEAILRYYEEPEIPPVLEGINNNYVSNDAGVYEFTYGEEVEVKFTKSDGHGWAYFYREVTAEEREGQNTLKMVFLGTPGDKVLVKPNDKGAYEMMLTLDANGEAIYEKYIDEPIVKIIVFVKPDELGTGTLTIVESGLMFVEVPFEIPVEELNHQIVVEELIDSGDGVYTFEQVGTTIKVIYDKPAGLEWTTMRVDLNTYPKLKDYNYFKIELKGTPEKKVLVKVNGIEKWVTFDAEGLGQVEFVSKSFNEILLFAEGGVAPVASSFEILNAVLEYRYDFRELEFNLMLGYTSTIDESGNLIVTYTDVSGYMAQAINFPNAVHSFNTIDMRIETTPGVKVLFKANNKNEHELILTADDEGIILYSYELDETLSLILFVNPGGEIGVSGTLKITEAILRYYEEPEIPPVLEGINNNYVSNDAGVYEFTYGAEVEVKYTKSDGQGWAYFYREVTEEEREEKNTLKMVFLGTPGEKVLVKPNDHYLYEMMLTLDENGEAIYERYVAEPILKILVFVKPDALGTGTLTIVEAGLMFTEPPFEIPVEDLNHQIVVDELIDSGDGVYTFEQVGTTIKVIYDKPAGLEWTTMRVDLNTYPKLKDYNYFKVELKGTPEKKVLVKVNGIEHMVTFDAEGLGQAEFASKSFNEILLFAEGGVAPIAGSFEILNAVLEYHFDFSGVTISDNDGYQSTINANNNLVINYTDVSGYMAQVINFPDLEGFNAIKVVIETTPGVKVMFKPNDIGAYEKIEEANEDGIIEYFVEIAEPSKLVFFVNPGGENKITGSLLFVEAVLLYKEKVIVETSHIVTIDELLDSGDGVYTFEQIESIIKVTYDKPEGFAWANMKVDLVTYPELKDFNYFKIELKGTPDKEVLVKVNGQAEILVKFDENGLGSAEFEKEGFNEILLFAEGGIDSISGTFEIIEALLELR